MSSVNTRASTREGISRSAKLPAVAVVDSRITAAWVALFPSLSRPIQRLNGAGRASHHPSVSGLLAVAGITLTSSKLTLQALSCSGCWNVRVTEPNSCDQSLFPSPPLPSQLLEHQLHRALLVPPFSHFHRYFVRVRRVRVAARLSTSFTTCLVRFTRHDQIGCTTENRELLQDRSSQGTLH